MKPIFIVVLIKLLSSCFFNPISAQEKYQIDYNNCCFNYISASYVRASGVESLTFDPYYSRSLNPVNTIRFDFGAQLSNHFAIEFGYTRTSLWLKKDLTINERLVKSGGQSDASISFKTFEFLYNTPVFTNKLHFISGIGYALGNSNVPLGSSGTSNPKIFTNDDITYTETSTITGLHSGKSHFLILDLGLEYQVFNRVSVFSSVSYFKGFKSLQEQEIQYIINGSEGTVSIQNDGSFVGLEFGIKYKFFPHFMVPVSKKIRSFMGIKS